VGRSQLPMHCCAAQRGALGSDPKRTASTIRLPARRSLCPRHSPAATGKSIHLPARTPLLRLDRDRRKSFDGANASTLRPGPRILPSKLNVTHAHAYLHPPRPRAGQHQPADRSHQRRPGAEAGEGCAGCGPEESGSLYVLGISGLSGSIGVCAVCLSTEHVQRRQGAACLLFCAGVKEAALLTCLPSRQESASAMAVLAAAEGLAPRAVGDTIPSLPPECRSDACTR
jgi:hypothetical protein